MIHPSCSDCCSGTLIPIQQKCWFKISEILHAQYNSIFRLQILNPTQATVHLVIVLFIRIQKRHIGDNHDVKWKWTFWSSRTGQRRPSSNVVPNIRVELDWNGLFYSVWAEWKAPMVFCSAGAASFVAGCNVWVIVTATKIINLHCLRSELLHSYQHSQFSSPGLRCWFSVLYFPTLFSVSVPWFQLHHNCH